MDLRALNDCVRHRLADKRTVTHRTKWPLMPQRIPAYVLTVKTNGIIMMCMANNAFTSRPAPLGGVGPSGLGDTHDHTRSNHMDTTTAITVTAWVDPLVDDNGHDPRSRYTDEFWAPVLGPSATLIGRTLAYRFDDANGASFASSCSASPTTPPPARPCAAATPMCHTATSTGCPTACKSHTTPSPPQR